MNNIPIERTKKGHPALWEQGGGYTKTGKAQVIAGPAGEALRPVFVRTAGHLANQEHALFVVRPGYFVVQAERKEGDLLLEVYRIKAIEGNFAQCELLYSLAKGEWDVEPPAELKPAIKAARDKVYHFHCREPHYAVVERRGAK